MNLREAIFSQESGEVLAFLITITHPQLAVPIYLSTDPSQRLTTDPLVYGTISRGHDYLFVDATITIPDEQEKSPPNSKLTISNVNRLLIPLARSVSTPPTAKIEAVLVSAPDDIEMTWPALDMSQLQYDANQLTFDLTMDSLTTERYPSGTFSPAYFPGLFI